MNVVSNCLKPDSVTMIVCFQQEGSLCAQHCLNALLQNQYFSAVDLAQIGERLDDRERDTMAEGGVATNEYQQFIEV